MVRNHKRKTTIGNYSGSELQNALQEIKSGKSLKATSVKFKIPRRTSRGLRDGKVRQPGVLCPQLLQCFTTTRDPQLLQCFMTTRNPQLLQCFMTTWDPQLRMKSLERLLPLLKYQLKEQGLGNVKRQHTLPQHRQKLS